MWPLRADRCLNFKHVKFARILSQGAVCLRHRSEVAVTCDRKNFIFDLASSPVALGPALLQSAGQIARKIAIFPRLHYVVLKPAFIFTMEQSKLAKQSTTGLLLLDFTAHFIPLGIWDY